MKLLRKAELYFREGNSDKIYEVDLCRLAQGRYVVNFRYGRRGTNLREGTKTTDPVDRQKAENIYNSVVVSKLNKGYRYTEKQPQVDEETPDAFLDSTVRERDFREKIETAVLKRWKKALESKDIRKLRRAVWRIGELSIKAAVPGLIQLIPAEDELLNYCTAWALGRCGDNRAFNPLGQLHADAKTDQVKHIALEAILATATGDQRKIIYQQIIDRLPPSIKESIEAEDINQLAAVTDGISNKGGSQSIAVLETLYLVAFFHQHVRRLLISILSEIPFAPGFFRAVRRIYKAAEFRLDAEVFGLIAFRMETAEPVFHRPGWGRGQVFLPGTWELVRVKDEVSKPNSQLAFSNRTRDYFRRRTWRMLRRMGQSNDERYVSMATGVLLAFTDAHACTPKQSEVYRWERDTNGQWRSVCVSRRMYGPFGGYVAFNYILHANSPVFQPSPRGLSWMTLEDNSAAADPATGLPPRQEAFSELWDRQPQALFKLLTTSRCAPVHRFAARALIDNETYCEQLSTSQMKDLLAQPYAETVSLGLAMARKKYDPSKPDYELIQALLAADLEDARQTARQWIEAGPDMLQDATSLMVHILTSVFTDIREWGLKLIDAAAFSDIRIETMIGRIVAYLMGLEDEDETHQAIVADIESLLLDVWIDHSRRIDINIITDLLQHSLSSVQTLAARLLLHHRTPAELIPPELIRSLIEAPTPDLRGIGAQIFSGLPEDLLLRQADLIFSFCLSADRQVRRAAYPLVKQLAEKNPAFGRDLFNRLLPFVFRKESAKGVHQNLVALLSEALKAQARQMDHNTVWRLLQARSKGATRLGAELLPNVPPEKFSVRQWAHLGNHAVLNIRQRAWRIYQDHTQRIRQNPTDGLRILDSSWDDTREFARDYFRNNFEAMDWTPELLISICDSVREDVQRFGRELITTFFDEADGAEYLLKLGQHPAVNVQLFASNFLEQYAQNDPVKIKTLVPFFVTVLSQVNSGRVAKTRVMKYLHEQAVAAAEAAAVIAPVIERLSATIAVGDRGECIKILRDITKKYPQIPTRLTLLPVERRQIRAPEVDHAV